MKATLEFDFDDPVQRLEHRQAIFAAELFSRVLQFDDELRKRAKYNDDEVADEMRQLLRDTLGDFLVNTVFDV